LIETRSCDILSCMQNAETTCTTRILDGLNPQQQAAVTAEQGPTLVLAGAGTGKTRVLAYRVAFLVDQLRVDPQAVLAVTFTNKAAREMRDRIDSLLGSASRTWVGTFHAFGLWILRRHTEAAGISAGFTVCSQGDQLELVRQAMKRHGVSTDRYSARSVLEIVRRTKRHDMLGDDIGPPDRSNIPHAAAIYDFYQSHITKNGCVDFDDLLLLPITLFRRYPDILNRYQTRFQHMLVDEYQDTNRMQFYLARMLTAEHRNLFVVGDEDQSIYGWRGAEARNVTEFKESYPDGRVLRLEQNYRSTQNILDAANGLIVNNAERIGKKLWTRSGSGARVGVYVADSPEQEAQWIARQITETKCRFGDCAVLFRTNAQSREFEDVFVRQTIPYEVVAGTRFYQRREIKDVMAYLRVAVRPDDDLSLTRVLSAMPYGIGARTIDLARSSADEQHISLYESLKHIAATGGGAGRIPLPAIRRFLAHIDDLAATAAGCGGADEAVTGIIEKSGYLRRLRAGKSEEDRERAANVEELVAAAEEFSAENVAAPLDDYLNNLALLSDVDTLSDGERGVALMTIHAAKGLEFPVVFVAGMEEGLLPHAAAFADGTLEEERRLCYVAMTRARERLYLTASSKRHVYGSARDTILSRFVSELPEECVDWVNGSQGYIEKSGTDQLRMGMRVQHPQFGAGYIMYRSGKGDKAKVKVKFDNGRIRQFMVSYARFAAIGGNQRGKRA